jgi:hypothetical protein
MHAANPLCLDPARTKICRRRYVPAAMDCAPSQVTARQILVLSPPRHRPSRGTAGQKPIGLCHPGQPRNQRTTLQDCSRQRLSRPLAHTAVLYCTSTYCWIPPYLHLHDDSAWKLRVPVLIASHPWLPVLLFLCYRRGDACLRLSCPVPWLRKVLTTRQLNLPIQDTYTRAAIALTPQP